jgi:hypothetical protein
MNKRWVIKIGSALLTNDGKGLDKRSSADNKSILLIAKSRGLSANSWSYFASSCLINRDFNYKYFMELF